MTAANSAYRVAALTDAWEAPTADRRADGPVLLVDDLTDTGWTLTMAARRCARPVRRGAAVRARQYQLRRPR